jgi:hypothetical protein
MVYVHQQSMMSFHMLVLLMYFLLLKPGLPLAPSPPTGINITCLVHQFPLLVIVVLAASPHSFPHVVSSVTKDNRYNEKYKRIEDYLIESAILIVKDNSNPLFHNSKLGLFILMSF